MKGPRLSRWAEVVRLAADPDLPAAGYLKASTIPVPDSRSRVNTVSLSGPSPLRGDGSHGGDSSPSAAFVVNAIARLADVAALVRRTGDDPPDKRPQASCSRMASAVARRFARLAGSDGPGASFEMDRAVGLSGDRSA